MSVASHNAYEMMRLRYGVTQKTIIELAPILFSIVASYALKVPEETPSPRSTTTGTRFTSSIARD